MQKVHRNFNPGLALIAVFYNRVMGKLIRRGLCRRPDFFLNHSWQREKTEVYSCLQNAQWVL